MNLYPVNLDIKDKICLIIGGGEVAARKIEPLLACGAKVIVVSPEVVSPIEALAKMGKVEWRHRPYQTGDLAGAFLVFAATDNRDIQRSIADEAHQNKILVNCVDDPTSCSFQVPARVRRGNFLLTVSTGGGSPALAAKLRKELEEEFGPEYRQFVELLGRIREKIVSDGNTSASHKAVFEKLLQLNIVERIHEQEWTALRQDLGMILPKNLDVDDLLESLGMTDNRKTIRKGESQSPIPQPGQENHDS